MVSTTEPAITLDQALIC